jgi:hypothetical protein
VMTMTVGSGMDEEPSSLRLANARGAWDHPPVRTPLLVGGLALAAGLATPAHAVPPPVAGHAAQCASAVVRDDITMLGGRRHIHGALPPVAARVRVVVPACHDSNGPPEADGTTMLYRRRGIPASVALFPSARQRRGNVYLYTAVGSFPQMRHHPLHRFLYGSSLTPDATRGRRCKPASTTALVPAFDGLLATVHGHQVPVTIDASTRISAPHVDGVPRLTYGKSVRVRGVDCGGRVGLVARVVTERRGSESG